MKNAVKAAMPSIDSSCVDSIIGHLMSDSIGVKVLDDLTDVTTSMIPSEVRLTQENKQKIIMALRALLMPG